MKQLCKKTSAFMNVTIRDQLDDFSLLTMRLVFGGSMFYFHGWPKLMNFESLSSSFPDPLGVGSTTASLLMALSAEVLCSFLVTIGFLTRIATIPLMITMAVAFFIIHANDPFERKELALFYLVVFLVLMLRGAGKISIDHLISKT